MTFAVFYIGDQAFGFSKFMANELYEINVADFVVAADVVDFADPAVVKNQIDGFAVVFHIDPVPCIQTIAIYGQRIICQRPGYGKGNQFLRMLAGASLLDEQKMF